MKSAEPCMQALPTPPSCQQGTCTGTCTTPTHAMYWVMASSLDRPLTLFLRSAQHHVALAISCKMVTFNNILRWPLRDSVCDTVTDKQLDNTPPREPCLTNCCLHSLPYQASHLALPVKSSMPGRAGQQHGRWQSQWADGQEQRGVR